MHGNLAAMEPDLSISPAPTVADTASTTAMRRADELLGVLAQHSLNGSDPGGQTKTFK
jgi:hypothetical protein